MKTNRVTGRPLFMFCALFVIFSFLLAHISYYVKILIFTLSASALIIINIPVTTKRLNFPARKLFNLGTTALAIACLLSGLIIDLPLRRASELAGSTVQAEIYIEDIKYTSSYYGCYTAHIKNDDIDEKVYLRMTDGSADIGDVFSGTLTLSIPLTEDSAELYSDRIFLNAEAESATYIKHERSFRITKFFSDINDKLSVKLRSYADNSGNLASAVLLGDREHLDISVKRDFSRLGIYHLLAVSGLHLSAIVSIVEFFLNKTKIRHSSKCILKALSILIFMALVGFSSSVMRAGIMHLLAVSASLMNKDSDSLTSLSIAASIIILINPLSVYDVGLVLSVLAAYACITYSMLSRDKSKKTRPTFIRKAANSLADTMKLTLLINAITLPIMWCVFGELSLISPLTNVIFIPLVTVLLFLAILYLPLCAIPYLSSVSAWSLTFIENVIIKTAERISNIPYITVSMRFAGAGIFAILLFLSVIPIVLSSKKLRKILSIGVAVSTSGLAVCLAVGIALSSTSCQLYYAVRGKNDGFVIRDGNDYTVVDISDGSSGIHYDMLTIAKEAGAVEIDTFVLTHYHKKHISSLPVTADRTILRSVLLPAPENDDEAEICEKLISACAEREIKVIIYERASEETCTDGGLTFDFHEHTLLSRSTHPVVSFTFTLCGRTYVYAGGSASEGDSDILSEIKNADTVFFGAHPPITKSFSGIEPHGDVVVSGKAVNDTLLECLNKTQSVNVVKDREIYSTGTYKKAAAENTP